MSMVWVALAEAITARIPTALSWIGRNLGKIGLGLFAAEQAAEATVWVPGMLGWLPEGQRKQIESNALTISNTLKIVEDRMRSAEIAKRDMAEWEKADNRKMLVNARVMLNELTQKVEEFKPNLQATNNYDYFRASIESMEARMSLSEVVNGIKIAPKSTTSKIAGIVKDVHDGDTITLESGEVVRLVGIDSPEASTAAGVVSGDFLRSMISGKSVEVRSDPAKLQDIYNRRLGVVYLGGVNINVEMLKNAYAVPYYMEPNSEVYEKVWTAAYEEGKALNIDKPLGDLKQALYDAYDALKNWRIYGRNELRAAYNAGLDTLRSDEKVELDDIAEAYANALEEMKGIYSEQLADIAARKSAKAITAAAAAEEKKTARTNYLKAKEAAQKWRREEKAKIKDPHKKEKAARYADYQINYKKIDAEYAATRKALRDVYNLNVDAVKNRTGTPGASPPATTATANYPAMPVIAPPQTSIPVITAPAAVVTVPAISTKPVKLTFTYNTPRRVESGITGRYKNELG